MSKIIYVITFCISLHAGAQEFTEINSGDIGNEPGSPGYSGVSFIDFDGDEDLDIFINPNALYENNGSGAFSLVENTGIEGNSTNLNNGNSWADMDNDGDIDLILVNQGDNGIYSNNGDGTFTLMPLPNSGGGLNGWAASWADYDNDGWLDLAVTSPCGFIGPCHTNWLFNNNGDGSFSEITDSDVTTGLAAYTVGNWADFDDDGDMDYFIGSGEVGFDSQDHIYVNQLIETGSPDLVLTQTGTLFGDTRDGQNWNFVDYDNDGDLDAFVTNFKNDLPNDFFRNNGNGTFTKLLLSDLGVHMTTEIGTWLGNTWGDYNNDGWIDVMITADFGSPFGNHMYLNNGDGTFIHHFPIFANQMGSRAVVNGDYDNDGDLDLYINSTNTAFKGLYRNELITGANANWLSVTLEGTISNRSAVGASVKILATIDGESMWIRRDVSTQSGFCGQNDIRLHFGLGDAEVIDSLVIDWPLGLVESYGIQSANQFLSFIEGVTTGLTENEREWENISISPNPAQSEILVSTAALFDRVEIVNLIGELLLHQSSETSSKNRSLEISSLRNGIYLIQLYNKGQQVSQAKLVKY